MPNMFLLKTKIMDFDTNQALKTLIEKYNQAKLAYENFMNMKGNDLKLPKNVAMPLARNHGIDMVNEPWNISTYYREKDYENYNPQVIQYIKTFNEYREVFITYRRYTVWIKTFMTIKNFLNNQEENRLHSDYFIFNRNNNYATLYKMLEDVEQPADALQEFVFNQNIVNVAQLMNQVQIIQDQGQNIYNSFINHLKNFNINWEQYNFNTIEFNNSYERIVRII